MVTPENFLSETFQFNTFDFEKDPKRFGEKFVKYIRLKPSLKKEYDTEYEALFSNRKNVIGIAIRRGIEWLQKTGQNLAIGHQCDSEFSLKIELLKNKLSEYKADAIFVTSDDSSVIEILKEEFGEKLLYINRKRNSFFDKNKPVSAEDIEKNDLQSVDEKIQKQKDYIKEIYFLSKCNSLIASTNGGSVCAALWNCGKYEHTIIENSIYEKGYSRTKLKEINGVIVNV